MKDTIYVLQIHHSSLSQIKTEGYTTTKSVAEEWARVKYHDNRIYRRILKVHPYYVDELPDDYEVN